MKKIISTICIVLFSISSLLAQENKDELQVKLKNGVEPTIYVDGKKFDFPMDLIDPNRIASVNVIKGEKALKDYNAKNGAVLITTKKTTTPLIKPKYKDLENSAGKNPMVIIDEKESTQKALKKLKPENIESVFILKKGEGLKKYNAPNGVIIVTTKKGKKK